MAEPTKRLSSQPAASQATSSEVAEANKGRRKGSDGKNAGLTVKPSTTIRKKKGSDGKDSE
jgi:hypothetical protein